MIPPDKLIALKKSKIRSVKVKLHIMLKFRKKELSYHLKTQQNVILTLQFRCFNVRTLFGRCYTVEITFSYEWVVVKGNQ